jgi:hypothetical protein
MNKIKRMGKKDGRKEKAQWRENIKGKILGE